MWIWSKKSSRNSKKLLDATVSFCRKLQYLGFYGGAAAYKTNITATNAKCHSDENSTLKPRVINQGILSGNCIVKSERGDCVMNTLTYFTVMKVKFGSIFHGLAWNLVPEQGTQDGSFS
ncbi:hypothetical protein TNCT_674691 [Trichonephila clavata]|uniref:Uncharacterized protein n=1 Tax=Trichonephila clavata TaxID=2740835 RepID=A0A8X6KQS7_TRICU|nr:hypothetical protein TNCT_674691 [Trichonephila clavata]